jgi:type II secretory pathway predicted ATPase ExeA
MTGKVNNPFRPGAGHMPPFLAGRQLEIREFKKLIKQDVILENIILTGLRGLGKTVLLDTFKPLAIKEGWLWAGTDLSESSTISEESIAVRLLADLSVVTSSISIGKKVIPKMGFGKQELVDVTLNFDTLREVYSEKPGLVLDKLRHTLEYVWSIMSKTSSQGIVFAYDEAQNLSDHAKRDEYPLSLMLDLFQYLQKNNIRFMLVLSGLPTLFPKLVEARAFAERMFHIIFLDRLTKMASRMAIMKPIEEHKSVKLSSDSVKSIIEISSGYPYFIQFICREVYDVFIQKLADGKTPEVPVNVSVN